MNSSNKIILLKLGGSLLTDKNKPFSIREGIIKNAIKQIIDAKVKIILIHGGGSFGHPVAKKFNISAGLNPKIPDQILGLAETHQSMNKLNSYIVNLFLEQKYPTLSLQTSSIFVKNINKISTYSIDIIEAALDLNILPILYGDIILDKQGSFSIISGDKIILELCANLNKYNVSKVIFTIETDGLFITDMKNKTKSILTTKCYFSDLEKLDLANLGEKIDVTGGIRGKINIIKQIGNYNIPVQIVNGLKNENILKALKGHKIRCTEIKPLQEDENQIISKRKLEHIQIPIKYNVQHSKNYFKYIELIHHPLPDIDLNEIDLTTKIFNKTISAPICISAITGGHPLSKDLNEILARSAENENIIMSVGSQRAGLINPENQDSFQIVRKVAPNIPIIGNIGIGQIGSPSFNPNDFMRCIEMINADVMAIHFNALHELVQDKGDISYKLFMENFSKIRELTDIPIIAKEVGSGFDKNLAEALDKIGFDGFDVGGAGGTSFAAIESYRVKDKVNKYTRKLADVFREWGIPTPVGILNVRKMSKKLIIATGGLRTGVDIAKSIVLGADIGGFAFKFLKTSLEDQQQGTISNTVKEIKTLKKELKSCLWLLNLRNVNELKENIEKRIITGKLAQWISN
ncbi:MAG: type 2 isopentenyl-diphosphate Delta-isomerase [Promethearchaeota archaeon]|nr:MAG: type 2 isopentenyl-diphosphate Delta-isomerase [Candidatus Lokiarchaeota archaeon]